MPSQKNIDQVKNLQEKLEKAKSLVLADYKGLTVVQQQDLQKKVKEVGGELTVTKNTLLALAFKDKNYSLPKELSPLTGPNITLFCFEDELAPLKALYEFSKENDLPEIRFGFLKQAFLTKEKVEELAELPSKDQLQAQLVGMVASPIRGTVYILKGSLNKLVMVLKAIQEKQNN